MRISEITLMAVLIYSCIDTAISIESTDEVAPELLSFSCHPLEVVNRNEKSNVLIVAHIVDDQSGLLNSGSIRCHSHANLSHIHFYSADWDDEIIVNLFPSREGHLRSGDAYDGVYTAEIDVSDLAAGNWTLDHIYLIDNVGNSITINDEKSMMGIPNAFVIDYGLSSTKMAELIIPPFVFVLLFLAFTLHWVKSKSTITSRIKGIYMGDDGVPSISKAQFFIWTFVAVFAYLVVLSSRILLHSIFSPPSELPYHLLIAMGLSVVTASAAEAIDIKGSSKRDTGMRDALKEPNPNIGKELEPGIFTDDRGRPDLSKIQMMVWTGVAIIVFLIGLLRKIWWTLQPPEIPDIDEALLALMGIGQSAYITKKIISVRDNNMKSAD